MYWYLNPLGYWLADKLSDGVGVRIRKKMFVYLNGGAVLADHNEDGSVAVFSGGHGAEAAAYAVKSVVVVQETERVAAETNSSAKNLFHVLLGNADQIHSFLNLDVVSGFIGAGELLHDIVEHGVGFLSSLASYIILGIADAIPVCVIVNVNGGELVAISPLNSGADNIACEGVTAIVGVLLTLILDVAEAEVAVDQVGIEGVLTNGAAKEGNQFLLKVNDPGVVASHFALEGAIGNEVGIVIGLASLVFCLDEFGTVGIGPFNGGVAGELQGCVTAVLVGVDNEIKGLACKLEALGGSILTYRLSLCNRCIFFNKTHGMTS